MSLQTPLLAVEDLHTHFRTDDGVVKAVDGVSFTLEKGKTLGIVGESGSGKSVTSLSIIGLIAQPPGFFPSGAVRLHGRNLLRATEKELRGVRGNQISMIFQDPMSSLNPYLKISAQLTEVLRLHKGCNEKEARARAIDMLGRAGLPDPEKRIDQYPHEFSGGMRQRVMIAMALLCEPEILIADEPTTALDVTIQAQILDLIRNLQKESETAVILITHDLGVVAGMADEIAVMYAGRIVEQGTTQEIFSAPAHPYTRGLLESIPRLDDADRGDLIPIPGLPPDLSALPPGCPFHPRCRDKIEKCEQSYPPATTLGKQDSGRFASCWLVEGSTP